MSESYKKLILGLLCIIIAAASWFFVIKPVSESTSAIKSETNSLKTTLEDLKAKEAHRQEYIDGTAENYALFEERLAEFPSNLNQEYQIEFVEGVRKNSDINYNVVNQGMTQPTAYYVLGGSGAVTTQETAENEATVSDNYECYSSIMTFAYEGDYEGIKKFVDFVASYPYRMTIDNVTVGQSEDKFSGSMTVNIYCITGKDREENMQLELDNIDQGVDNLFTGGSAANAVSKFAEDNGKAIINDYDLVLMVNPTSSDTSGKSMGLKSGGTNITSSKNEIEAVSISVSKVDGKYIMEYAIGSQKQTQEFEPGEDLTILIQSSDIKDSSDKNGANISLENTTDMPLYVKIADDATAQRIKIVNRAGSISVYK